MHKGYFISGIGTGIGKTVASAVLVEHLQADYWKPVQCGDLDDSDSMKVKALVSHSGTIIHPEQYRLQGPYSPHKAADLEGIRIDPKTFSLPKTDNTLIVEGAGGLLVPLNDEFLMADLVQQLGLPLILIVRHYLGSINHTLLSLEVIGSRGLALAGIVFNGPEDVYSESVILKAGKAKCLGRIAETAQPNQAFVREQAARLSLI